MKTEDKIISLWKSPDILCSIACTSFNHEKFIEETIKGFLVQETDFAFEIIIHDDASTDETQEIIKKYQKLYPKIIKPILQIENQKSKGIKPTPTYVYPLCHGKFIAKCESDDYWTDPLKLQKQVDFLEANNDFAICHHNMKVIYEENAKESHLSNSPDQKEVTTIEDLAFGNYIYTASCVFRNGLFGEYPDWFANCPIGDYPLHMLNAQFGKIKYLNEVMGVYRVHKGGLWAYKDEIYRIGKWVDLMDQMKHHFTPEINKILIETQNRDAERLLIHYKDHPDKCKFYTDKLVENDPLYVLNLKLDNLLLNENVAVRTEELKQREDLLNQRNDELYRIINSRTFKLSKIFRSLFIVFKLRAFVKLIRNKVDFTKTLKLIGQSGLFDALFYLENNPDVKASGMPAIKHYLRFGGFEGRNPSPDFDSAFYLEQNPDVKNAGMNPLAHFIIFGIKEGRLGLPKK